MPAQFCAATCVRNYFNGKRPYSWLQASWRMVKGLSETCKIAEHAGTHFGSQNSHPASSCPLLVGRDKLLRNFARIGP
jgi:hypothetical protein